MRLLILILMLVPNIVSAQSSNQASQIPWQCRYADNVLVFEFSDWSIFPTSAYVREGEKVCVVFRSLSDSGTAFRVQNLPIGGSVKKNSERVFSFVARKVQKHKVECVGSCREAQSFIEVLTKAEHDKLQNEVNKFRSIQQRPIHNIGR